MAQAKIGDTVKVHYTGKTAGEGVFDSSVDREPLQFTLGNGMVIPGFEEAIIGMNPGESKTVDIPQEKAYGSYHEEGVITLEREQLPPELEPKVGQRLQAQRSDGQVAVVTITDISESKVTLDANHPLAGKTLTFDLTLVEIV